MLHLFHYYPIERPHPFMPIIKKTGKVEDAVKLDLNNLPDLLTVKEVANLLRVSPLTVERWGARGKLQAIRINSRGDRRYKKDAVLWLLGVDATAATTSV
jgi:excisionase family DNA binding protein